eukprot:gnl/MRDRNA2_/MRDRNA2_81913_c0_seq2.p1 gnl/MRDRNA2_/MRDRNA2_81913_c0~~gnl/MRDRNA2_/MRDRNA2_81913_c0_seq2.p1  ORF type:complete len:913 (+),score=157.02 gnl/MRDRNA2_/MRDRNA2_81913_c0_seq2:243-2981(+)
MRTVERGAAATHRQRSFEKTKTTEGIAQFASQHRIFHWMKTGVGEENQDIHPKDVVDLHGVPQGILLEHLEDEIEEETALLSLPPALWLLIIYVVLLVLHDRAALVREIEDAITWDVEQNANFAYSEPGSESHKGLYDLNTHVDFYSWLQEGVRPLLLKHRKQMPEDYQGALPELPQEQRALYMNDFNALVGGVRIMQERMPAERASDADFESVYKKPTYPDRHTRRGHSALTGKHNLRDQPSHFEVLMSRPDFDPALTRWLMLSASEDELDALLKSIQAEGWMHEKMLETELHFLVYNAYFETLTYSTIRISQSRSGHLWRSFTHDTMFMRIYGSGAVSIILIIFDALFVAHMCWIFVYELYDTFHHARLQIRTGHGFVHFLEDYVNIWNIVDWISIAFSFALIIMFVQHCMLVEHGHKLLADIAVLQKPDQQSLSTLFDFQQTTSMQFHHMKYIAAVFPMVCILRLFKAFSAQPRMALVTSTLAASANDILHFGIAFCSVFFTYAVLGMITFGRTSVYFSRFEDALSVCFEIIFGSFEMEELYDSGRTLAALFFSSFVIIVFFIMLNMLMAMIMDGYTTACSSTVNAETETVWQEAYQMYRRWRDKRRGLRVSLQHIHECYTKKLGRPPREVIKQRDECLKTLITVDQFCEDVEGLGVSQAHRLLVGSLHDFKAVHVNEAPLGLSEAIGMVSKIHSTLEGFIRECSHKDVDRQSRHAASKLRAVGKLVKHLTHADSLMLQAKEDGSAEEDHQLINLLSIEEDPSVGEHPSQSKVAATGQNHGIPALLIDANAEDSVDEVATKAFVLSSQHSCETLLNAVICGLSSLKVQSAKAGERDVLLAFACTSLDAYVHCLAQVPSWDDQMPHAVIHQDAEDNVAERANGSSGTGSCYPGLTSCLCKVDCKSNTGSP